MFIYRIWAFELIPFASLINFAAFAILVKRFLPLLYMSVITCVTQIVAGLSLIAVAHLQQNTNEVISPNFLKRFADEDQSLKMLFQIAFSNSVCCKLNYMLNTTDFLTATPLDLRRQTICLMRTSARTNHSNPR